MGEPDESVKYPFYVTMDEVLLQVEESVWEARHADNDRLLKFHLQMASRALRCALLLYMDWAGQQPEEIK
jgi:hypothetical protein